MYTKDDDIIDVDFEDVENNYIKGNDNIRYTASQVAAKYDVPVSTVRYYAKVFEDILGIEVVNKRRVFTSGSLKKFEYILKLKNEDNLTVNQIIEYCERSDIFTDEGLTTPNNPLPVEMLSTAVTLQVSKMLDEFKTEIVSDIIKQINHSNSLLKEDIVTTIDEVVSEKLQVIDDLDNKISDKIDDIKEKQDEVVRVSNFNAEIIREQLEARRQEANKPWYLKLKDKLK